MSCADAPRSRDDGLPMRESGTWARDKQYYVERYMDIFNSGMKNYWRLRAYVDLMAGPGRCCDRDGGDEFDGSPLIALSCDPPFTSAVFVESDPDCAAALETRTESHAGGKRSCD